jgi:outer membrane protein insertion porin family
LTTILNYLSLKKGQEASAEAHKKSIHSIYDTTHVETVKVTYNNGTLKVYVEEMPLIIKVMAKGNGKIGTKTIDKAIETRAGHSLKMRDLDLDVQKILEIYKKSGRFAATVRPEIKKLPNNRVKVIFHIAEGPKTAIKKIRFIGNRNYRDHHLRATILTRESAWWRFLSSDDTYDPDRIEYDQMMLANFYQSVGYADFKMISANAELAHTKDSFTLTYAFEDIAVCQ